MLLSLQMVLFAYVGIEMIGLSAGEAENPQKTIPMAIDSLAWRILIFYMGAILVILAIFPWNEVLNYFVPDKAFQYMMAAVTFVGLMVWIAILFTQMKFRHSLTGEQVAQLGYRAPWWPYSSWFALAFIFLVVVMMGFHEDARIALILGPCLLGVYLAMFYMVGLHRKTKLNR